MDVNSLTPMKIVNKILKKENTFENDLSNNPYLISNSSDFYAGTSSNSGSIVPMQDHKIFLEGSTYLVNEFVNSQGLIENELVENDLTNYKLYTNDLIYGQGDLTIYISQFDNFIRLTLYRLNGKNVIPYDGIIDNSENEFNLVYIKTDGSEIRVKQHQDEIIGMTEQLNTNDLLFRITKEQSRLILNDTNSKINLTFTKMLNDETDYETVLYSSKIDSVDNFSFNSDYSVNKILLGS